MLPRYMPGGILGHILSDGGVLLAHTRRHIGVLHFPTGVRLVRIPGGIITYGLDWGSMFVGIWVVHIISDGVGLFCVHSEACS